MRIRRSRYRWLATATTLFLAGAGCGLDDGALPMAPPASGNPAGSSGTNNTTFSTCEALGQPADEIHRQLFTALNNYRTNGRLTALQYSKTLERAADAHAADMYRRGYFSHQNPDGQMPWDRATQAGYCEGGIGENIASGYPTVSDVQTGWQNSPGHNENMLRAEWEHVGMGHFLASNGVHYWVQLFGTPSN